MNTESGETIKSIGYIVVNDSTIQGYVARRIYREGTINFGDKVKPYVTIEVDFFDNKTPGLPSYHGNVRVSVWNSNKQSEFKRITEEIAHRVLALIGDDEEESGADKINTAGTAQGFSPRMRYINLRNFGFTPATMKNGVRHLSNYEIITGQQ